ncbi:MAG: heme-binding beta-barrel domain-containing protein, partial [Actinomycetota bacterium]
MAATLPAAAGRGFQAADPPGANDRHRMRPAAPGAKRHRGSVRAMGPALHPDLVEVSFVVGTWRGTGEGQWPRGEPFQYGEELTFEHV